MKGNTEAGGALCPPWMRVTGGRGGTRDVVVVDAGGCGGPEVADCVAGALDEVESILWLMSGTCGL